MYPWSTFRKKVERGEMALQCCDCKAIAIIAEYPIFSMAFYMLGQPAAMFVTHWRRVIRRETIDDGAEDIQPRMRIRHLISWAVFHQKGIGIAVVFTNGAQGATACAQERQAKHHQADPYTVLHLLNLPHEWWRHTHQHWAAWCVFSPH